jgi:hypothetical protein
MLLEIDPSTLGRNKDASFAPDVRERVLVRLDVIERQLRDGSLPGRAVTQGDRNLDGVLQILHKIDLGVEQLLNRGKRGG